MPQRHTDFKVKVEMVDVIWQILNEIEILIKKLMLNRLAKFLFFENF
jgi:hypothetical protein